MRYRCVGCKGSFTHYPQGVARNGRGVRLRMLMSLTRALGLSRRSVERVLTALGPPGVVDRLGLERQVCVTHARKNAARRPRKAKGWGEWKPRLRNLFDESPMDGGKRLTMM